jgi:hypothetical protein
MRNEILKPYESSVEAKHVKKVKMGGGKSFKFRSPGYVAVPDRLNLYPVAEQHIDIVGKYVNFTELKAPKNKPTKKQMRVITKFREMGYKVEVWDGQ